MTNPTPTPKRHGLLIVAQVVIALGATYGSLFLLGEFGHEPAWPMLVGIGLFLVVVWWIAIRGARSAAKPGAALGVLGFALIVIGYINLTRAESALRTEIDRAQHERLAVPPGGSFREDDDFGKECEKVFGYQAAYHDRIASWTEPWTPTKPEGYPAMAKLVEERRPGWPRVLQMFARANIVEGVPVRNNYREDAYGGRVQVACGHFLSSMLGLTSYRALSAYARSEKRLRDLAEADREIFLNAWKNRPKDQP